MRIRTALLGLLAGLGLGCMSVGEQFDPERVPQLQIGVTQRADVRALLGDPWRTGIEDGLPTWTYAYYRYALFGPAQNRDLIVRFDEKGVVRSYAFSSTYDEDRDLGR